MLKSSRGSRTALAEAVEPAEAGDSATAVKTAAMLYRSDHAYLDFVIGMPKNPLY